MKTPDLAAFKTETSEYEINFAFEHWMLLASFDRFGTGLEHPDNVDANRLKEGISYVDIVQGPIDYHPIQTSVT